MSEVAGKLVNMRIRVNGTQDEFKILVCTEDSQFQITNETSERRTNCGVKASAGVCPSNATSNKALRLTRKKVVI